MTIHDDVISHVNISNLKEEDGGEYMCAAKNSVSQVTHSARINVYGLPFIRVMPKITAVAGNDLVVKCPVAGYPIESIIWERGTIFFVLASLFGAFPCFSLVGDVIVALKHEHFSFGPQMAPSCLQTDVSAFTRTAR